MKKQTAVEWLVTELNSEINYIPIVQWDRIRDLVQRAKAMEREQIIQAANNGCKGMCMIDTSRDGKNYYNETYGGQDEKML